MKLKRVGEIAVDTGLCWIGDPGHCVTPDATSHPAKTWRSFCNKLQKLEKNRTAQWGRGTGVTVQTGCGDGIYPVYVKRNKIGEIIAVVVKFD